MRRGEGPKLELRFLISFKTAGFIIGKGGENINKIREEYSVKISISDSSGPERVLVLDGDMGSIMEILSTTLNRQLQNNHEEGIDLRLLVHQSQAGCVIGRGGYKIKELREQSNLKTLKVYQMLCPGSTDRVIQLVGDVDKVTNCLQAIAELLEGAPPKGSRKNYDALDVDESLASEYGGWGTPTMTGQGLNMNMINRRSNMGAGYPQNNVLNSSLFGGRGGGSAGMPGGGGAGNGNGGQAQGNGGGGGGQNAAAAAAAAAAVSQALVVGAAAGGGLPHASAAAMLAATGGQSAGGPTTGPAGDAAQAAAAMVAAGMMRGYAPHSSSPSVPRGVNMGILNPTTTTQVSVQNKMIGAIMGRAGCRINQVRQESGADIKISKQEPGVEDRIITITGTPEQIHNAQFLMQVCVKRYGDQQ